MPLVYLKEIDENTRFAIWKIEESAEDLLSKLQLSRSEKAFLKRLNKGKRTLNWLGTRVLLRKMLDTPGYVDCPSDENGKPYLVNFPHKISLSHSFDYAAVMLSTKHEVGIDMELVKPKIELIAKKFMKPQELADLATDKRIEQLYACWCAKEAVYKLQGKKGVSFKDNIFIEPFQYSEAGGFLKARLNGPYQESAYTIYYERFEAYMLGYVMG
ncbi:4'-phosphopantetheinyl transferase superfamily protein [Olivibacter sp. SDN3]|uniref:4'-phosphopantetheinyl transferase family protein n=1 Tax=Olivibacter sp. SDN3 TaxID=2764720 RepID=UPI001650EA0B|nr:4'-phosphopantetheinyl transferase superfamily protein [Olivibacter sp. SDN3]QNL50652.1 4'-phosphopantetheinyl transferase superfamily protein [Olivibacter sp. SDN3]